MKITYVKNRLRSAIDEASPVMAQTSLDRAEALLAEMGDDCRKRLDELLAMFPSGLSGDADAMRGQVRDVYETARLMVGVGTVAGLPEIDVVARSLCDAADGLLTRDRIEWEPLGVHISTMTLLRKTAMPDAAKQQLLAGLEVLRGKYAAPTPPQKTPASA
jgi:hypothetical protein